MRNLYQMKNLKKFSFVALLILMGLGNYAQEQAKPAVEFYGFIRVDAYTDSYKGLDLGHDIFYLLPNYEVVGDNKLEVNECQSANLTAIASRLGAKINGPDVFNAKLTGVMEFDFAGNLRSDPTLFRIRQAFSQLSWEKSSLLIGQTWHPFFGAPSVPTVAGLNTGAPFHTFNRSPMIRYNYKLGGLNLTFAGVYEMQYTTATIDTYPNKRFTTNHAKRNAVLPELVFTADFVANNKFFAGAGAEYKTIKPRMLLEGAEGAVSKATEIVASTGFVGYLRYKTDKLNVLFKGYMGENLSHLVMPGGYGVATYDAATGKETYTNYSFYTVMFNAVYGKELQLGIFAGYGQNLGTGKALYNFDGKAKTVGSMQTVQDMMRIAPHLAYNKGKMRFVLEYEMTSANFGTGGFNFSNGLYNTTSNATNNRVICTMTHFF